MNKRRRFKAKRRRALLRDDGQGWLVRRYDRIRVSVVTLQVAKPESLTKYASGLQLEDED